MNLVMQIIDAVVKMLHDLIGFPGDVCKNFYMK